jgi:hypothetical protein
MNRRAFAALATALAISAPLAAFADPFTLSGSYYRYVDGNGAAPAIAGLRVFLYQLNDDGSPETQANWSGPVLTDAYGRYFFANVPKGSYVVRAYLGKVVVAEQTIDLSASRNMAPLVIKIPS